VARTEPDGTRYRFTYDTELRLTEVTNPLGRAWRYTYDAAGQLVREVDFNGRVVGYAYDDGGEIMARETGLGARIEFARDLLGRVVEKRTPEGVTSYVYDPLGRLLRATGPDAELVFQRDPAGHVVAEAINGRTVVSRYNAAGRRVFRAIPGGHDSTWEFDAANRPVALTAGAQTLRFGYDAAGREVRRDIGAPGGTGLSLAQAWDPNHRLIGQALTVTRPGLDGVPEQATPGVAGEPPVRTPAADARLVGRGYSYRTDGRLTGIDDDLLGHRRLELDAKGRVTAVRAAGWTERYAYDAADNLVDAAWPGAGSGQGAREYDGTLLRRAGQVRYETDAAGRTVGRHVPGAGALRYTWDAEDRVTSVTTPEGLTWRYRYDPLGRRIAKERVGAAMGVVGTERTEFVWDGGQLAAEIRHLPGRAPQVRAWDYLPGSFTPVGQTEREAVHGPGPESADGAQARFYAVVADPAGTPTELVTPGGEIVWQRLASLWGRSVSTHAADGVDCPLRFAGQYYDTETGDNYNYHRYYEPGTARYHSPDPLGLTPAPNPHAYVPNPTVAVDPLGLAPYTFAPKPAPTHMLKPGEGWHPSQGTPVIGRLPDTSVAATFPGHAKLTADPWTLQKNDAWVQTIVDQRGKVYVASPTGGNYWNVARQEPSVFAREIQQFLDNGYHWDGDYLVPPAI
jgi:RHS repeat-associated protein